MKKDISDIIKSVKTGAKDRKPIKSDYFSRWRDLLIDTSGIGFWDRDLMTGKMVFSSGYERLLGFKEGELRQSAMLYKKLILPEDLLKAEEPLADYLSGETEQGGFETEYRMYKKDGSVIWVLDKGTIAEWDEFGRPVRLVGITQDITRLMSNQS